MNALTFSLATALRHSGKMGRVTSTSRLSSRFATLLVLVLAFNPTSSFAQEAAEAVDGAALEAAGQILETLPDEAEPAATKNQADDAGTSAARTSDEQADAAAEAGQGSDHESAEGTSPADSATAVDPYAAADDGQDDLSKASVKKLGARQLSDLQEVVALCESALKKGLDPESQTYAQDLMAAALYDHAFQLSQVIFEKKPLTPQWPQVRQMCLELCQRTLELRPKMGLAHLMVARLHALPGGDRQLAFSAAEKAIELLADNPDGQSDGYRIRGGLQQDPALGLSDLNKAVELNPRSSDAWRSRGLFHMMNRRFEEAMSDLQKLLDEDPDDLVAHQAIAQTLSELKEYDKAIEHLDEVLQTNPDSAIANSLKAQVEEMRGNIPSAIESLNTAIRSAPRDVPALLYRARLRVSQEQFDLARSDVARVLRLRPGLTQAILLRSLIAAAQDRMGEAIGDIQSLLKQAPENDDLQMQLATYFEYDQRPRRAIEIYNELLSKLPSDGMVLRRRGDARLSIGEQAKAIDDYREALKSQPDDTSILNNLAWVLSTSTDDGLRDGKQALKHATRACELTDHQAAHILSTLAAAYAETGDFENAIKWSTKAVELAESQEDQLAQELESYKANKPWREKQETVENPDALTAGIKAAADDTILDIEDDDPLPADDTLPEDDPPADDAERTPAADILDNDLPE